MKKFALILLLFIGFKSSGQIPCINGLADGLYPCNQVSLYAVVSPEELLGTEHGGFWTNDIWGWTDPETGKEYAIVGLTDGVAFVDVTAPSEPVVIGKLEESPGAAGRVMHGKSTWRDMKVFKDHVFVVSDRNAIHGMQVFDLKRLRDFDGSTPQYFTQDAHYDGVSSVHNIAINESTGFAYIVGTYTGQYCIGGGLHIVDINDPLNPQYAGCFDEDGYTHDAQCVIYNGPDTRYQGMEICFNSNEDTFTIVDVDDKEDMHMISRTGYNQAAYTHQGWLSEDHRFFLMNDELDEGQHGFNPRTLIWNIEDLENPRLIGEYYNEASAIDHNLYTHQGLVYESNYLSGLRVMDLSRIAEGKLREVAFFDTYPESNTVDFGGAWSNYPYFESGTIIVSDMNRGLFVLKLDRKEEVILTHPEDSLVCEGKSFTIALEVTGENLTYQWQKFNGMQFIDLTDDDQLSGTTTPELTIESEETLQETPIRCKIQDSEGSIFYSFPTEFEIDPLPVADFNFSTPLSDNSIQNVTFTNNSQYANSYFWDFGDSHTSTKENPVHEFDLGSYTVSLIAANTCGSDTSSSEIFIVTGLDDPAIEFTMHPNPSKKFVKIKAPGSGRIEIRNISGQLLKQETIKGTRSMDLGSFGSGMYLVTFYMNDRQFTQRLILN